MKHTIAALEAPLKPADRLRMGILELEDHAQDMEKKASREGATEDEKVHYLCEAIFDRARICAIRGVKFD